MKAQWERADWKAGVLFHPHSYSLFSILFPSILVKHDASRDSRLTTLMVLCICFSTEGTFTLLSVELCVQSADCAVKKKKSVEIVLFVLKNQFRLDDGPVCGQPHWTKNQLQSSPRLSRVWPALGGL